ncbi:hypothetical protein HUZ36_14090 [Pseudoalteromonas sp. McH1-7]|uniref:Uncharacterized protein n=1 Tax=Pseudoalteromonas peptidolytica F12-50-A1 TaxID=1315280 RepID=A0A8I0T5A6_9GAMM|nr:MULTISPECIES: hypothetical protein [Pseudoalteromonas]MBE0347865.1 hypothetical protein [Pseudoalteromonas peptidolytica F12-50-A1]MDW7551299.1 hypothetical protein [Pseudoalteromonas peptidolytica]NLR15335.1 hypothetical protein [Pseudoalteromonas peptidolytica]NUZ11914.1 hypothetical protein [Pseudoalteromonas sp. McH1-7]RRS09104.1 hypothetical protein EAG18_08265 [Pseudoalteromonas sp. J010]
MPLTINGDIYTSNLPASLANGGEHFVTTVTRDGFTDVRELVSNWLQVMVENGYKRITRTPIEFDPNNPQPIMAVLESTTATNSLNDEEPYRIRVYADTQYTCEIQMATPLQLGEDFEEAIPNLRGYTCGHVGESPHTVPHNYRDVIPLNKSSAANATTKPPQPSHGFNVSTLYFIDVREFEGMLRAYPMSYRLSITDRGFSFAYWVESDDQSAGDSPTQSWMVLQRPVDQKSGNNLQDADPLGSRNPIFCLYGIYNKYIYDNFGTTQDGEIYTMDMDGQVPLGRTQPVSLSSLPGIIQKFTVREKDVLKPTYAEDATLNTRDSNAWVNEVQQQTRVEYRASSEATNAGAFTLAGAKYVILYPNRLNTKRFRYQHDMDMVAYTSADVIAPQLTIKVNVYNEGDTSAKRYRKYTALTPNSSHNTNMTVLMLTEIDCDAPDTGENQ